MGEPVLACHFDETVDDGHFLPVAVVVLKLVVIVFFGADFGQLLQGDFVQELG